MVPLLPCKVMVKCLSVLEMTKRNPNTNTIVMDKYNTCVHVHNPSEMCEVRWIDLGE